MPYESIIPLKMILHATVRNLIPNLIREYAYSNTRIYNSGFCHIYSDKIHKKFRMMKTSTLKTYEIMKTDHYKREQ